MHSWKVGGISYNNGLSNANVAYNYEVGDYQNGFVEEMKIGLMYVSDYGYAASSQYWEQSLNISDYGNNNWLYINSHEWLLSFCLDAENIAYHLHLNFGGAIYASLITNSMVIRPTFYLNSNVAYVDGDGTQSDPYRVN